MNGGHTATASFEANSATLVFRLLYDLAEKWLCSQQSATNVWAVTIGF